MKIMLYENSVNLKSISMIAILLLAVGCMIINHVA